MNKFTLERKLAAPVACTDCDWNGKAGSLRSKGTDPYGTAHCPICGGARIIWIEAPSTTTAQ